MSSDNIDLPTATVAEDVLVSMAFKDNEAAPDGRHPADVIKCVDEKVTDSKAEVGQDEDSDDVINVDDDEIERASATRDISVSMALQYKEAAPDGRDPADVIECVNEKVIDSEAAVDQDEDSNEIFDVEDNEADYMTACGDHNYCDENNEQCDDGEESAESFVPRSSPFVNTESGPQAQTRCPYYNVGYCKFRASCRYFHSPTDCLDSNCFGKGGACMNRHRIICEMAQKGKCNFGSRCEFFHNGQTGLARTPLPSRKTRQPRRKAKREDRRRGGSDSESNASGDTDSNRSYNESRSNSHRNGSTSRDDEDQREKMRDVVRKLQQDVENKINNLERERGNMAGFVESNTEKVNKLKRDLEIFGKEANEGINSLQNQLVKTTEGFKALQIEFYSLKRDCKTSRRNQENKLKELSVVAVQDSTHVSDDEVEGNVSIHELTMTTGLA